jgi:hypothetical protein
VAEGWLRVNRGVGAEAGVKPVESAEDLTIIPDPFESDAEYEEFLADLYASRRAGIAWASSFLIRMWPLRRSP